MRIFDKFMNMLRINNNLTKNNDKEYFDNPIDDKPVKEVMEKEESISNSITIDSINKANKLLEIINKEDYFISKTIDPDEYFNGNDSLMSNLNELSRIENISFINGTPEDDIKQINDNYDKNTELFIDRSFEKIKNDIKKYISSKEKRNILVLYYLSINKYKDKISRSTMCNLISNLEEIDLELDLNLFPIDYIDDSFDYLSDIKPSNNELIDFKKNDFKSLENIKTKNEIQNKDFLQTNELIFPDWYITISFGKSTSLNYEKAILLAKRASQYHEQYNNGNILHQAIYSDEPKEFLKFVILYDLIGKWKSSFVFCNGVMMDKQILKELIYCYGNKCRSKESDYCYGSYGRKINPFPCRRIGIARWSNQLWRYYSKNNSHYILNKQELVNLITNLAKKSGFCPKFNYDEMICALNSLSNKITSDQYYKMFYDDDNRYQGNIY